MFGPDVDGSGTNQAYCTSQAEYDAAYSIYMQHVTEAGRKQQEEDAAFEYHVAADAALDGYIPG